MPTTSPSFESHLTTAFSRLRSALDEAVNATGVPASAPQDVARRLGISRNLTWKVSKVVCTPDLYQALQHLPGDEGIEILLKASEKAGVASDVLERVRAAQSEFDRVVEVHTGDRATLEVILDGMGGEAHQRLEQSRKLAFRGNSGIWGVQARARFTASFLAPSKSNPALLDSALVGGLVDFRRLRSRVRWPLFRPRWYNDDGTPMSHPSHDEAIDPAFGSGNGPRLMGEFCSPRVPPMRVVRDSRGWIYELEEGPIGNTGACTCFFGEMARGFASRYRSPTDTFGELSSQITLPIEMLHFDLVVHHDLEFAMHPEILVRGHLDRPTDAHDELLIPIGDRPRRLKGHPPVVATPLFDRYDALIQTVFDRAGWDRADFNVLRLTVAYPPMHSTVVMRFPLPSAPGE